MSNTNQPEDDFDTDMDRLHALADEILATNNTDVLIAMAEAIDDVHLITERTTGAAP